MICPLMLKQTKQTEKGMEEWERQPCLEEACSLFFGKKKKCALFHNSETTHELRSILEKIDFVSSFQVIKSGLEDAKDDLSKAIQANGEELAGKLELAQENLQDLFRERAAEVEAHLTEKVEGVLEEVRSLIGQMDSALQQLHERQDALEEKISGQVQEGRQVVLEMGAAFQEQLDRISREVQWGVQKGLEEDDRLRSEQAEAAEGLQQLMGENQQKMEELLKGNAKIEEYYGEQKKHLEEDDHRRRMEAAREQNNRGIVFFHRGGHEAAVLAFEKAVDLDPEYAEAYNNLGMAYTELDRSEHAVQAFTRALTLRPDFAEAYNNLGLLYYAALDYEKATEMFSKALRDGCKDTSLAYTNFGHSLYQLGRYREAGSAWDRALQLNPLNRNARKGLELLKRQEQEVS
jgi:Tfp pilus assembly protein PilF